MKINIAGKRENTDSLWNIDEIDTGSVVRSYGSGQDCLFMVVRNVDDDGTQVGSKFLVDLSNGDVWDEEKCDRAYLEVVDATIEIHEEVWE